MEALLEYLREQQEQITTSYEMDTPDYYYSRAEREETTKTLLQKYVSVFRIDGEPIIPPLMTSEKRRQMQKLKEKALKIEQRMSERRLRLNKENCDINEERLSETSRSSVVNTAGSISHRSQDYYDAKLKESEESMMILQDLIRRQSAGDEALERNSSSFCANSNISPRQNNDKLKKLQKSETLIYDNSTNEVIKQIQNLEETYTRSEDQRIQLREHESNATLNYVQPRKPSHLLLAGLNDGQVMAIPSICINPPTPLVGNRQICEPPSVNDSFSVDDSQHLPDDLSSDESFNSMFTHSDDRPPPVPNRKNSIPRSGKILDLKAYNEGSNVTAKIQQFEAISSDHSSPGTTPNSSPVKGGGSLSKLRPHAAAMSRSATSPSIKLSLGPAGPQTTPSSSENSPDNPLVRSSSFTLEGPSKALIDHMRQQRSISERPPYTGVMKTVAPITSLLNLTRKVNSPSRVHRDTIESKAKRVQKVDLKPSRQKTQQKTSQHKLAQAAAASMSPYKTNSSSFPTNGSNSNLYKTKKSPYDSSKLTKSSHFSAKTSSSHSRKSPPSSASSLPSQKISKTKCPVNTGHPNSVNDLKSAAPEREALTQMDRMQKDKFLRLLKQQEEEQRKLKQAFEMQQKLLIEQLNKEMAATQIKSTPSNSPALPSSRASSALLTQRSVLSPDSKQHHTNMEYSQQSFDVSNDSSLSSVATLTQNASGYCQVPLLPISNLSSMDHSNANTSFESSSILACDQSTHRPESVVATTTTPIENGLAIGSGGGNSASRRRLFPQEHMKSSGSPTDSSIRPLSIRSSSNHRSAESQQHNSPTANKGHVGLTNSANSRRPINIDEARAAATTINAYARGFLIRRLFQTEQIQRIVRTMRDTLVFVLNLHIETCQNPAEGNTAANIKLKARLLQQLSSASRTLHFVFFQTTAKERMDIIARDRKRIKTKLLALSRKRTPRIAG